MKTKARLEGMGRDANADDPADEGPPDRKPSCYTLQPCECGCEDVVVSPHANRGMVCKRCGADRGCPRCKNGPVGWRVYESTIECSFCDANYPRPMDIKSRLMKLGRSA